MTTIILYGDCRQLLPTLPAQSVQCVVTSPPYFGLRSYLAADDPLKPLEIGQEPTIAAYVAALADVFAHVWRVLRDDGVLWLNLGDSYANDTKWGGQTSGKHVQALQGNSGIGRQRHTTDLPSKSLMGIPWRVAFALQDTGWILRSDIIWEKPNAMPESVTDRPTRSHEYLFLFAKQERYFYNNEAIKEPAINGDPLPPNGSKGTRTQQGRRLKQDEVGKRQYTGFNDRYTPVEMRNKRSVWRVSTGNYSGAHFATFPENLIEPCIFAGSRHGDTVLDPFGGSGTVGQVAEQYQRHALLIELNSAYSPLIDQRTDGVQVALMESL